MSGRSTSPEGPPHALGLRLAPLGPDADADRARRLEGATLGGLADLADLAHLALTRLAAFVPVDRLNALALAAPDVVDLNTCFALRPATAAQAEAALAHLRAAWGPELVETWRVAWPGRAPGRSARARPAPVAFGAAAPPRLGLDALHAAGLRGAGVRIVHVEEGQARASAAPVAGVASRAPSAVAHGAAVGHLLARCAPEARVDLASPWWPLAEGAPAFDVPSAVLGAALSGLGPGDVLLVEIQTPEGLPASADPGVRAALRLAVRALGVVAVEAAGNGGYALPAAPDARADAEALRVGGVGGAGEPLRPLGADGRGWNWGPGVDVYAPAEGLSVGAGRPFGGTSAAAALIAGGIAALQSGRAPGEPADVAALRAAFSRPHGAAQEVLAPGRRPVTVGRVPDFGALRPPRSGPGNAPAPGAPG